MSLHGAKVLWKREGDFLSRRYSRLHVLDFDHGVIVRGSASPSLVRPPFATHEAVDPEAAFVASLSACHMLWVLDHAVDAGLLIEEYEDQCSGVLAKGRDGRVMMTTVTLRPLLTFEVGRQPTEEIIVGLHRLAHDSCFIANSVTSEVVIEPVFNKVQG